MLANKKIAIVGGGPGGLTLARLLQSKGAAVKVYERDYSQEARVQGAIVDLHFDSGLKVIKAAGLLESFQLNYMPGADKFRLLDKDATILFDEPDQGPADFNDERFRPEIDRGALRDLLIASLAPDTVVWDSQFAGMQQVNSAWQLSFKNGTTAMADLVIGADGYRSKVRPYVTDIKERYSGATIIQGEINDPQKDCPEVNALVNKANLIAMGVGKTIAAQPRGDGGITFYTASLYPENWIKSGGIDFNDNQQVYDYLVGFYADWDPVFHTMFKAGSHFVPRPLNYFPLDQHWHAQATITLIGDAAHLMPPSGEGVNTAMLDALDLSECIANGEYNDLQAAIAAYEQRMRARAAVLGREALEGIKDFASPGTASIQKMLQLFDPIG
ncbi:2-polyprenyl-6-methoxyphenol hydroxylase [Niastella koreensis]|uniref:Flavin-dependent monooxygenase n=2 Tax=Niastella koreensis TaxID=354356 RepID=G8TAW1_NIAKG|nr:NAD(P)/FAD-dependent oxidoreductase [Niastella koreensis]AEW00304.1 monooxygenase FAD-binding protein [Niastella koreensis GR20-10]OQP52172.1 2-polyprenyl-6-methoxyphenol hydroxylase [Niastella koreensis]